MYEVDEPLPDKEKVVRCWHLSPSKPRKLKKFFLIFLFKFIIKIKKIYFQKWIFFFSINLFVTSKLEFSNLKCCIRDKKPFETPFFMVY